VLRKDLDTDEHADKEITGEDAKLTKSEGKDKAGQHSMQREKGMLGAGSGDSDPEDDLEKASVETDEGALSGEAAEQTHDIHHDEGAQGKIAAEQSSDRAAIKSTEKEEKELPEDDHVSAAKKVLHHDHSVEDEPDHLKEVPHDVDDDNKDLDISARSRAQEQDLKKDIKGDGGKAKGKAKGKTKAKTKAKTKGKDLDVDWYLVTAL